MRKDRDIQSILDERDIDLAERIGQHLLIDKKALDLIGQQIITGANILEIGTGPGNLTEILAERAVRVVGVEIDRRFQSVLEELQGETPNLEVIFSDALAVNYRKLIDPRYENEWQIFSNLPFHISEPFLKKVVGLPVENIVLVVGDDLARSMQVDDPESSDFSKTSFLAQTFFEVEKLVDLDRDAFYPPPRTNASIVVLTPRGKDEFRSNPRLAIQRHLIITEGKSPTVGKVIKEARDNALSGGLDATHKSSRRKAKQELRQVLRDINNNGGISETTSNARVSSKVDDLGLPERILSTPFSRLSNQEVRELAKVLRRRYS